MSKTVAYCALISCFVLILVLTISAPDILSDSNSFLRSFVNHEFLAIMGIMLTITLASAGQIHLALNETEEKKKRIFLSKTRSGVRSSSYWLIALFLIAVIIVVVKPNFQGTTWAESFFNGMVLFILFWTSLVLLSLTQLIFAIKPEIDD